MSRLANRNYELTETTEVNRFQNGAYRDDSEMYLLSDADKNIAAGESELRQVIKMVEKKASGRSETSNELHSSIKHGHGHDESLIVESEEISDNEIANMGESPEPDSTFVAKEEHPSNSTVTEEQSHKLSPTYENLKSEIPFSVSQDSQLRKLMNESSELAKELKAVFDILAARESQLVDEMTRLKLALTGAVAVLTKSKSGGRYQNSGSAEARRYRRDHSAFKGNHAYAQ
jgi:hypothetical protein